MSDRVGFTCNGADVEVDAERYPSLLLALREALGVESVKDGCAPQGQCGCCTVLVDGDPRIACVTPVRRVAGRSVTTVEGLAGPVRERLAGAFVDAGGSQCGFCTPGIAMRLVALRTRGRHARADLDRALAAHLCRCTGWQTVYEAAERFFAPAAHEAANARDADAAAARASLEGAARQSVGHAVALGGGGFADDLAPRDALVAVPLPPGSTAPSVEAAGAKWVVGATVHEARERAGKVQGRRTTAGDRPPIAAVPPPPDGVSLATGWVEPAYLEPDASWCAPGGEPATPLANGGAFGGKVRSPVTEAARALAGELGRPVRVLYSREDVVRLGPKRPPISATAVWRDGAVVVEGRVAAGGLDAVSAAYPSAYALDVHASWTAVDMPGPPIGGELRAAGLAETAVLVEGALDVGGVDRAQLVAGERAQSVLLDTCVAVPGGALAGARVTIDGAAGTIARIDVRVAAGSPLDPTVLRSYAIGAAHMALGWVCTESLAVDADGVVHDLTIRSFGIVRAKDVPPVDVTVVAETGPPCERASDAVFAAVAAATWNAITRAEGVRPDTFPARAPRAGRALRR